MWPVVGIEERSIKTWFGCLLLNIIHIFVESGQWLEWNRGEKC